MQVTSTHCLMTMPMKTCLAVSILSLSFAAAAADFEIKNPTEFRKIVPEGAQLEKRASGMKFAEGPVWIPDQDGYLIFSDLFSSELKKWSVKGGLTTFRQPPRKVPELYPYNGNTVDRQGRLLTGGHGERRITRTEKDGS